MIRVALGRLLARPHPRGLLERYASALGEPVVILDARERVVFEHGHHVESGDDVACELTCEGQRFATVRGGPAVRSVAVFLEGLCRVEVERKVLGREALDRYRELTFLYEFTEKITSRASQREVAELVAGEARTLIHADAVSVWLRDADGTDLQPIAMSGGDLGSADVEADAELRRAVVATGEVVVVDDADDDDRLCGPLGELSLMLVPLRTKDSVLGVLRFASRERHEYGSEEVKLAFALTSQGAIAIQNAHYTELLAAHRDRLEAEVAERTHSLNQALERLTAANEKLDRLSMVDGLTGVANRRCFDQSLDRAWEAAARTGQHLALLMIDVDCFKLYNDTYGHQAGDECLRRVADVIGAAVRSPADIVARYGGEEFAAVLTASTLDEAQAAGERIRYELDALALAHRTSLAADHVTISVGVAATIPEPGDTPADLLARADDALYRAKDGGRNRVSR